MGGFIVAASALCISLMSTVHVWRYPTLHPVYCECCMLMGRRFLR